MPLVVILLAYSRAARSHTSSVLTCCSSSHFRRTRAPLIVSRYPPRPAWSRRGPLTCLALVHCSRVSVTPGVISSQSSHTPCVGLLFSQYPSRLAWSRRGLLTHLAWAHCSHGIHHAWHGLITVFSHALRGLVVLIGVVVVAPVYG